MAVEREEAVELRGIEIESSFYGHLFAELRVRIEKRRVSGRKGRPQKGEEMKDVFFVEAELRENAEGLERERRSLGRFILASNDTSLSG